MVDCIFLLLAFLFECIYSFIPRLRYIPNDVVGGVMRHYHAIVPKYLTGTETIILSYTIGIWVKTS